MRSGRSVPIQFKQPRGGGTSTPYLARLDRVHRQFLLQVLEHADVHRGSITDVNAQKVVRASNDLRGVLQDLEMRELAASLLLDLALDVIGHPLGLYSSLL